MGIFLFENAIFRGPGLSDSLRPGRRNYSSNPICTKRAGTGLLSRLEKVGCCSTLMHPPPGGGATQVYGRGTSRGCIASSGPYEGPCSFVPSVCAPPSPSRTALFARRYPSIHTPTRRGYRSIFKNSALTCDTQESITRQPGRVLPRYLTCLKALFTGFHMLYHLCR